MKSRLLFGWIFALTVLLVQRPLFAPGLWWNLARGREAASGSMSPSSQLLSLDATREADWCSGLFFFECWNVGGIHFLAAIPMLAAALLLWLLRGPVVKGLAPGTVITVIPLFFWTVRDGLQPVPELFDLCGLTLLWFVVRADISSRARFISIMLTFVAWANFGPRPILGLLWLCCLGLRSRQPFSAELATAEPENSNTAVPSPHIIQALAAAIIGGVITPRGMLTWRDSGMLFCPAAFATSGNYSGPDWIGAFQAGPWLLPEYAFLLLWSLRVGTGIAAFRLPPSLGDVTRKIARRTIYRELFRCIAGWLIPFAAVLLCRDNIPFCGLWILLNLCPLMHSKPKQASAWNPRRKPPVIALAMAVLCLILLEAAGIGMPPFHRLGWGISQEMDPRLLDASLFASPTARVNAWAPDTRSIGIAAWLNRDIEMVDHPQRALLGGRIPQHQALMADLLGAHRAGYRRNDGTWGGTVRQLAAWNVKWIFVPVEMPQLHRELVRSTWQPMDMDSPTVPFISTDYDEHSDVILETMAQQGFVELGPWHPTSDVYDGQDWRYDAIELLGGGIDPAPAIRQSRLFRTMDIPMASLRALLPVRKEGMQLSLANEFLACQKELAYQEWITFGEASYFRRLIVNTLSPETASRDEPWFTLNPDEAIDTSEQWKTCVADYVQGRIAEAIESLARRTPSQIFAAAMMQLELGESQRSWKLLEELLSETEDPSVLIAARYWYQQIGQFGGH